MPTEGGEGREHIVAAARLEQVIIMTAVRPVSRFYLRDWILSRCFHFHFVLGSYSLQFTIIPT